MNVLQNYYGTCWILSIQMILLYSHIECPLLNNKLVEILYKRKSDPTEKKYDKEFAEEFFKELGSNKKSYGGHLYHMFMLLNMLSAELLDIECYYVKKNKYIATTYEHNELNNDDINNSIGCLLNYEGHTQAAYKDKSNNWILYDGYGSIYPFNINMKEIQDIVVIKKSTLTKEQYMEKYKFIYYSKSLYDNIYMDTSSEYINHMDVNGWTPLELAIHYNHTNAFDSYINLSNNYPLYLAVKYKRHYMIEKLLPLESINYRAFNLAIRTMPLRTIKLFLENGYTIDNKFKYFSKKKKKLLNTLLNTLLRNVSQIITS